MRGKDGLDWRTFWMGILLGQILREGDVLVREAMMERVPTKWIELYLLIAD